MRGLVLDRLDGAIGEFNGRLYTAATPTNIEKWYVPKRAAVSLQ